VDLSRFATRLLRRLRPAALLVSGDLTDSKTESRVGSLQYEEEWAGVRRAAEALRTAASLPPSHLLAVRGNHDTFGVAERGGTHDMFGAWRSGDGVTEARATRLLVGRGTAESPLVSLLQLDASLNPGWRRPCNFAGSWSEAEAEAELGALDAPAGSLQLAFGHFPLSFIEGRRVERSSKTSASALGTQLAAQGVTAYLCGHLHWRFGDRLHHWHSFESHAASESNERLPLLELEAGDWKQSRAWRLLAVDASGAGHSGPALSFRDFVF
jgi:3',5'-cyclic AMP phosphodiesterase CpdA